MQGIKPNMGRLDRVFRILAGMALIYISLINHNLIQNDIIRYILAVLGIMNLGSSIVSHCPLYLIADIDTRNKTSHHNP